MGAAGPQRAVVGGGARPLLVSGRRRGPAGGEAGDGRPAEAQASPAGRRAAERSLWRRTRPAEAPYGGGGGRRCAQSRAGSPPAAPEPPGRPGPGEVFCLAFPPWQGVSGGRSEGSSGRAPRSRTARSWLPRSPSARSR